MITVGMKIPFTMTNRSLLLAIYFIWLFQKQTGTFVIITIFQTQILSNFFMVTWVSEVKNAVSSEFHLCGSKSYT